jgi:hypothetical protein
MGTKRRTGALVLLATLSLAAVGLAACDAVAKHKFEPPVANAADSTTTTGPVAPPSSTTSTVTQPPVPPWPERTITDTGSDEDFAPTSTAVYWLTVSPPDADGSESVTPARYDLTTRALIYGPSYTGLVGNPALTVTGGWVWIVYGARSQAFVEQMNPTTLEVISTKSLEVANTVSSLIDPNLTATVNGPLWIAAGEHLWALNPSTGAVQIQLNPGIQIASMSTSPSGTLLYTGGQEADQSGMVVTEYEADTGRQLLRTLVQGVGAGTVAAAQSGVWVSVRSGMAGSATELADRNLAMTAPPSEPTAPFNTFYQIMGVGSGVSEGVLWLTSLQDLTCGNPITGEVRSTEWVDVYDPIAGGGVLYAAAPSGGVVAITPPSECF